MQDNNELIELKTVYDELWADAKTLIKDMKKSVYIYNYAAMLTYAVAVITLVNGISHYATLAAGQANTTTIVVIIINVTAIALEVTLATILYRWYRRMKRRYNKLIEMENSWRKTDA